jgi:hypothetical protein
VSDEDVFVDVYIGAPAGDLNAECHRIKADTQRAEANSYGFDSTVRTTKRGEQTVYVYAVDDEDHTGAFIGSMTITITALLGDINSDGVVTISDVTRIQDVLVGRYQYTEADLIADVDGNGNLEIRDATYIQLYLSKFIDRFPVDN